MPYQTVTATSPQTQHEKHQRMCLPQLQLPTLGPSWCGLRRGEGPATDRASAGPNPGIHALAVLRLLAETPAVAFRFAARRNRGIHAGRNSESNFSASVDTRSDFSASRQHDWARFHHLCKSRMKCSQKNQSAQHNPRLRCPRPNRLWHALSVQEHGSGTPLRSCGHGNRADLRSKLRTFTARQAGVVKAKPRQI